MGTLAFSSILATLAPSRAWALELQGLDTHQGEVILAFTRQIYPHATLDNAVYALVVKDLDAKAKADPAVRQQLADGVKQLDAKAGSNWLTRRRLHRPRRCSDRGDAIFQHGAQHRRGLAVQQHHGVCPFRLWRVRGRWRLPVQGFQQSLVATQSAARRQRPDSVG